MDAAHQGPRRTALASGHLGRPEASPVRLPLQSPSPSIRRRRRSGAETWDGGRSFPGPPSRRPHQLSSPPPLGRALVRVRPDLARSALQVRRPPLQQTPPPISLLNGYHVVLLPCSPVLLPASLYDSPRWVSEPRRRQVQGPALAAHRRTRPPLTSLCASLSPLLPHSWWLSLPEVSIFSAPSPCCRSHAGPPPGRCLRESAPTTTQGSADGAPSEVPTAPPKMQAVRESESGDGWPACSRSEVGQRYRYDHSLLFLID